MNTLDVRPVPGMVLNHCTTRDVVSRRDVVEAPTRATATTVAISWTASLSSYPGPPRSTGR